MCNDCDRITRRIRNDSILDLLDCIKRANVVVISLNGKYIHVNRNDMEKAIESIDTAIHGCPMYIDDIEASGMLIITMVN